MGLVVRGELWLQFCSNDAKFRLLLSSPSEIINVAIYVYVNIHKLLNVYVMYMLKLLICSMEIFHIGPVL